jgi:signal transduction histidine kinase
MEGQQVDKQYIVDESVQNYFLSKTWVRLDFVQTLMILGLVAYLLFDLQLYINHVFPDAVFWIATLFFVAVLASAYFLYVKGSRKLSINIYLITLQFGILYYALHIGKGAGIDLFYFTCFVTAINLFRWPQEKFLLIFYLILPIFCVIFLELYVLNNNIKPAFSPNQFSIFYIINFFIAFGLLIMNLLQFLHQFMQSQKGLIVSKLNLQSLIDNSSGYIWSIDNEFKLKAFNIAFKEIIAKHYNVNTEVGFNFKEVLEKPNHPKEVAEIYYEVINGKAKTINYVSNGNHFEMSAKPTYDDYGKQIGASFYSKMTTHQIETQKEIQQAKINLETLINSISNSAWSISTDYKIIAANKHYVADMKRIFNADFGTGFDVSQLFNHPKYPKEWHQQYLDVFAGKSLQLDYVFDNSYFELIAEPIKGVNGDIIGAVFFSKDITNRKRNEQELTIAKEKAEQANITKAHFLSNMSHELRTPLNGIIQLTSILIEEQPTEAQKKHLEVLKYSGDHMLVLVNDILDYNKIESGKVQLEQASFNLGEAVQQICAFFETDIKKKGLSFKIEIAPELYHNVVSDVTRLRQVITNLLGNALKFTQHGSVGLSVAITQKLAENKCRVKFTIEDTGIGIAQDKLGKIFESFGQAESSTNRKFGGSGLGLTISKKLVELMGGELKVSSKLLEGSTFWFEIDFTCDAENTIKNRTSDVKTIFDLTGVRILVVEDNPVNQLVLNKQLTKWNAVVTKASNGLEAVAAADKMEFDVILMDLQMPEMDGFEATQIIRSKKINTIILALTATTDESLIADVSSKGMDGLIQKPYTTESLYNGISKMLGTKV